MGKSSPAPQPQNQTVTQTNLPDYAKPYFTDIMERAQKESNRDYEAYGGERIAKFTPAQEQIQKNVLAMGAPAQFGTGSALALQAGRGLLDLNYDPGQFSTGYNSSQFTTGFDPSQFSAGYNPTQFQTGFNPGEFTTGFTPGQFSAGYDPSQFASDYSSGQFTTGFNPGEFSVQGLGDLGNVRDTVAERVEADKMQAAQTQFQANLERFQMAAPDRFDQAQAEQYMSPYIRNVLDTQKREAMRDARQGQIVQDLGAARQGTYGGSRQLLAGLERERNLGQQLGDIEARGLQSAFESSQGQFERDRAAQMAAQQANLQAALGVQELGTTTGLQTALANLSNEQQARVQNMAAENQARGMNAENALRAALANQQADVSVRGQNLQGAMQTQQLGLEAQRLREQSNQFGSTQGLEAQRLREQANQFGSTQRLEAQRLNDLARQFGSQQGLEAQRLREQSNQFGSQQGIEAQRLREQSRQFGSQQGLEAQRLSDLARQFGSNQGLEAQRLGEQSRQFGTTTGLEAQRLSDLSRQFGSNQGLEAQRLREQSRQFGSGQRLAGLQAAGQMGQTLSNIGQAQQQADLQRLQAQAASASEQQTMRQRFLDNDYAEFLRERDDEMEKLGYFSNLMRGIPVGLNSTNTTYAAQPGMGQQFLGAGLAGLGAYNTFRGP